MVVPGTTWLCECIIVSNTIVSPESTCSTGGWALLNQPHCVVSIVAGRRCTLPASRFAGTTRRFSWSGVEAGAKGTGSGAAWVAGAGGTAGGGVCACWAPASATASVNAETPMEIIGALFRDCMDIDNLPVERGSVCIRGAVAVIAGALYRP